ncbi:tRNA (guanine-N1)-methyltransferase [Frondihabitans sp. PAMC 28766]|uniref:tRNA (guanosine(37)-N1)-methyltransferase TrmD n=1 Tax=Frondihabitans sp. PAMC 28766 TaxID=1795630 RepID=UPI00078DAD76|nr:tRNA (guanosine(37)-N1)-methyltransferase TrmD [Frondihabitans sp. PAMC 28766]AMM21261.1 tRNA (guanine-N1)-methyltransferase [Frondihabitans sp. PAMC 28766]
MRIDIVTIFPEFFGVLDVSLVGKARQSGLLDVRVHDLRDYTHDRHRTVDDTPYGGGAGMVMKPEPWGEALDAILAVADQTEPQDPGVSSVVIVPSPAGRPFTQKEARDLATVDHLVFACGRYEGIDQRVMDHAATRPGVEVREISLGDYVLNGGEVAAIAMIEAVGRLVPGMVGNPESLTEESHEDGLLEYPSYTKPSAWRGHEVPAILLGGNHGAIAAWRHDQQVERTRRVRPDLLPDQP